MLVQKDQLKKEDVLTLTILYPNFRVTHSKISNQKNNDNVFGNILRKVQIY